MTTNTSTNHQTQRQQSPSQPEKKDRLGFADKTLWDWLQLLAVFAVPLVVGIATVALGFQQANLSGAQVTVQQLAQASSLSHATMPDGSIHP